MNTSSSKGLLFATLLTTALMLSNFNLPALAQAYDMSGFQNTSSTTASTESTANLGTTVTTPATSTTPASSVTTYGNEPSTMSVSSNGTLTVDPSYVPGQYQSGPTNTAGTVLNIIGNITNATGTQGNPSMPSASQALLAPGSAYGFDGLGDSPTIYKGVDSSVTGITGGMLPSARYAIMDGVVNVAQ